MKDSEKGHCSIYIHPDVKIVLPIFIYSIPLSITPKDEVMRRKAKLKYSRLCVACLHMLTETHVAAIWAVKSTFHSKKLVVTQFEDL